MATDGTLAVMVSTYEGEPAVFTVDPAPGDAVLPYIVTAGNMAASPKDTKTTLGREFWRDVRCYDEASGSAVRVEAMVERVRQLFHRQRLAIPGFTWVLCECTGPIAADERDAYGRIVTVRMVVEEL
jgi:hypothetical protein